MRILGVLAALIIGTPCFATTCCWDGKTMACDSQASCGHHKTWVKKMARSDARHASMFFAGNALRGKLIMAYFMNTTTPLSQMDMPEPEKDDDAVDVLIVYDSGEALYFGGSLHAISSVEAPFAIGIGGDLALGAMVAGKTAAEAVQIAEDYDLYSGGKIHVQEAPVKQKVDDDDSNIKDLMDKLQSTIDSANKK